MLPALPMARPAGMAGHDAGGDAPRRAVRAAAAPAPTTDGRVADRAGRGRAPRAKEDIMSSNRHPSPLPPDPPMSGAGSPLPYRPRVSPAGSPLPPDPPITVMRPTPARRGGSAGHVSAPAASEEGETAGEGRGSGPPAGRRDITRRARRAAPGAGPPTRGPAPEGPGQRRSNRSRFITLSHAATKSRTNFSLASSWPSNVFSSAVAVHLVPMSSRLTKKSLVRRPGVAVSTPSGEPW